MYAARYHRPRTVAQAVEALGTCEEARVLSGGQTLLPTMKQRLADPSDLIDVRGLPGMVGVADEGDTLAIGAATTHAAVAASAEVAARIPGLAGLAAGIGDPAVRHMGTIGGSVANNDPAADYPAAILALNATIQTDRREIAADAFFDGMFTTVLEEDEIITSFRIPVPARSGYAKFRNPASRYALVGVYVAQTDTGVRVAITGAGADGVFRATDMEEALGARFDPGALDGLSIAPDEMMGDMHADAAYRAHLCTVMAKRAVAACG